MDNHIIWLEPFLKYNMGPFSWLYERMRPVNGKLFGLAGQAATHAPELSGAALPSPEPVPKSVVQSALAITAGA